MPVQWPKHIELSLQHNPHRGDYLPLETWIESHLLAADAGGEPRDEAIRPEDLAAIRATGEVWVLTWCPDTPVGSCVAVAATFERVLELAAGNDPASSRSQDDPAGNGSGAKSSCAKGDSNPHGVTH
ncbi:MAG: hypothetical protein ABR520_11315 [Mycobacteriales bacterium]|nr:hypothetical protein [Actinomycetota bacterium]